MIKKELAIFLVVGSLTVLVDYQTYSGILLTGYIETSHAKGIGFLTGTVFAYVANRLWTFGHRARGTGSAWRFAAVYILTLLINVYANELILRVLAGVPRSMEAAFVIATGLTAILNFFGMKLLVFNGTGSEKAT